LRERKKAEDGNNGERQCVRVSVYTCADAFDEHGESRRAGGGVAINYAEKPIDRRNVHP